MEAIGATAALFTLLEATAVIGKTVLKIHQETRDAPDEFEQVSSRILQTRSRLSIQLRLHNSLRNANINSEHEAFIRDAEALLASSVHSAQECLDKIEAFIKSKRRSSTKAYCLRWVLLEKRTVLRLLRNLQQIGCDLSSILITVSVSVSLMTQVSMVDFAVRQESLFERMHGNVLQKSPLADTRSIVTSKAASSQMSTDGFEADEAESDSLALTQRVWQSSEPKYNGISNGYLCRTSVIMQCRWGELRTTYSLGAIMRLPSILSQYVICWSARLKLFRLCFPSVSLSVSVKNVVSRGSRIMEACSKGDLYQVRRMMQDGLGRSTDIDEAGRPALHHAITSGSLKLVRFLLHNGADANDLEAKHLRWHFQALCWKKFYMLTSFRAPLQIAFEYGHVETARLLLSMGADPDHIDLRGHTVVTRLWHDLYSQFSRVEALRMLVAVSPSCVKTSNHYVSDPLVWAAMRGCKEDIQFLVKCGGDFHERISAGGRLITWCIVASNIATYDLIVDHMPPCWVNEVDSRGRGPLHLAVEHPELCVQEVVERVVRAGADMHARDFEGASPEDIARISDENAEAAGIYRNRTSTNLQVYLNALRNCGVDCAVDHDGEVWWPASEDPF